MIAVQRRRGGVADDLAADGERALLLDEDLRAARFLGERVAQYGRVDEQRQLRARARHAAALRREERILLDHDVEQVRHERAGIGLVMPHALDQRGVVARALRDERPDFLRPRADALARANHGAHELDDLAALGGVGELGGRRVQPEQLAVHARRLELDRVGAYAQGRVLDPRFPDRHGVDFAVRERARHVGERRNRDDRHVGRREARGAEQLVQVVRRRGVRCRRDAFAAQIRDGRDTGRAARDEAVEPFGYREDRAQVRVIDGLAQRLGFRIRRDVGRVLVEEIGDAAAVDGRRVAVEIFCRQQDGRELERRRVAVDPELRLRRRGRGDAVCAVFMNVFFDRVAGAGRAKCPSGVFRLLPRVDDRLHLGLRIREGAVYVITVSNFGDPATTGKATNVVLTDTLPANTTFVSMTQTAGPTFTITRPTVGGTGNVTATQAITVLADSDTDADAFATSTSIGIILNIQGRLDAIASATPKVEATVGGGFVQAGTTLTISAVHGGEAPAQSDGTISNVNTAGNVLTTDLGEATADLIFISSLVHHFDDPTNRDLMKRIARALRPGGAVVVQELIRRDSPVEVGQMGALLDLYFAMTSESGTWSVSEMAEWQRQAGLRPRRPVFLRSMPGSAQQAAVK